MKIFVLRHGMTSEAETDEDRELTESGVNEVENVVNLRLADLQGVARIYSSPLKRVKQTLYVARRLIGFAGAIDESPYLKTGSRLNEIISFVTELEFDGGDVLVSSHQSCTSILVLWLTGEDILISNGSLLAIEVDRPEQGAGKILWQESHNSRTVKRAVDFVDQF
ncbi:MAG: SixA phosphatase family protein [Woeseiaceae bacterium]